MSGFIVLGLDCPVATEVIGYEEYL